MFFPCTQNEKVDLEERSDGSFLTNSLNSSELELMLDQAES